MYIAKRYGDKTPCLIPQERVNSRENKLAQIENQFSNMHNTFRGKCLCIDLLKKAFDKSDAQMVNRSLLSYRRHI